MINYDSILSAFDGKPTLLQWLKMVKKALDESVLKNITVSQDGANVVFTFNFEDGTSISTPAVTLPKGNTGAKGDKGDKGEQGVSVTGVDEVSNEVVGTQTLTTLRFNFSNGTNNDVVVYAENGKNASGGGKLYVHKIRMNNQLDECNIEILSRKSTPFASPNDTSSKDLLIGGTVSVDAESKTYLVLTGTVSAAVGEIDVAYYKDGIYTSFYSTTFNSDDVSEF